MHAFAQHLACRHSQWPARYHSIAAPLLRNIVLSDADARQIMERGTCAPIFQLLQDLRLSGDGVFLKLAGFSFRGHPAFDLLNGQVQDTNDLGLLCSSLPGRVRWAMHQSAIAGVPVELDVFRWRSIPSETEIRIVVKERRITDIHRYDDARSLPDAAQISLAQHVFAWMLPDLPLDSILIDLTTQYSTAPLIEINPATSV